MLNRLKMRVKQPSFWFKQCRDLFILIAVLFAVATYMQRDMAKGIAPNILAVDINLQPISEFNHSPPQATLVYFWGSWCSICSITSPSVNRIFLDGTPVITVAVASGSNTQVTDYLTDHDYQFPVINQSEQQSYSQQWGAFGLPAIYIVDKHNQIAFVTSGATSYWGLKLRLWLTDLLA
ncbi:redoxin family protein [Shewanella intestini]|uniref:Redoxin family protein n=1 Tax=Shewanella intestini TaxID=2017544 RepID=A0ABS5I261_9GAMM|nr:MULTISPECIES: redoxin domain-containing protein [Shewanella]MBR9727445.1 redoxin family protein [Shewanella intestini]MRG35505.1 redoxin family protein [Shewanella sp. XMDDZSB0408]